MGRVLILAIAVSLLLTATMATIAEIADTDNRPTKVESIPFLTPKEILDPGVAQKYDVPGYLEITLAENTMKFLNVKKGGKANVTILLHFVSYDPKLKEIRVRIDPNGEGLRIKQSYAIRDKWGTIVERGHLEVNKLVSYRPAGVITVRANQTVPVVMTFHVPKTIPNVSAIPIGAVGVSSDVPIIDRVDLVAYIGGGDT